PEPVPFAGGGTATGRSGRSAPAGGSSQLAATIASNSARTQSAFAYTTARKASRSVSVSASIVELRSRRRSGVDLADARVRVGDLDPARLRLLRDRDPQGQHARVVRGGDLLGVQRVTEEQLAGEHAQRPFRDLHLHVLPHRVGP